MAWPRGRRAYDDEAGVSVCLPFIGSLLQQRLEGITPASRQCRDAQGAFQLSVGLPGKIEQGIRFSDAHALRTITDFHDLITGCDFAGFQHTEVEAGSVMLH